MSMLSRALPKWLATPLTLYRKDVRDLKVEDPKGISQRRESQQQLLFSIVSEALIGHGLLSSSWKFKALRLDRLGDRYLVLVTLLGTSDEVGPDLLFSIESWLRPMCLSRGGIDVSEVFWRHHEGSVITPSGRRSQSQRLSMTQYGGLHEL
ncbi:hypothetical protein KBW71_00515 [Hydrogenophaga aromaticivorans]|uniref:hypothetical protein n=1 Tax=Hydrogenophaga aromaticivorans TaxID=2610898 RepID=UPI001B36943A|nr:hypothetical protein [Hydrogenophaga aromaticivorans]MBQ0916933.1 hypothetical protein [Hydrogenophaga aromaticivorans]